MFCEVFEQSTSKLKDGKYKQKKSHRKVKKLKSKSMAIDLRLAYNKRALNNPVPGYSDYSEWIE